MEKFFVDCICASFSRSETKRFQCINHTPSSESPPALVDRLSLENCRFSRRLPMQTIACQIRLQLNRSTSSMFGVPTQQNSRNECAVGRSVKRKQTIANRCQSVGANDCAKLMSNVRRSLTQTHLRQRHRHNVFFFYVLFHSLASLCVSISATHPQAMQHKRTRSQ